MNDSKKVVILLAAYNGEKYISDQIDSILNQSYNNIELIISDDESHDRTVEIVKEYCKNHTNVKLIHNKNNGSPRNNFNNLISFALCHYKDEYIMFSDQDDIWMKNKIELECEKMKLLEANAKRSEPCLVYTNYYIKGENCVQTKIAYLYNKQSQSKFSRIIMQSWLMGCTMICNMDLLRLAGLCPCEVPNHDEWLAQIASLCGRIYYLHEPTMYHLLHENNATTRNDTTRLKNRIKRTIIRFKTRNDDIQKRFTVIKYLEERVKNNPEGQNQLNIYKQFLNSRGISTFRLMRDNEFYGVNKVQNVLSFLQYGFRSKLDWGRRMRLNKIFVRKIKSLIPLKVKMLAHSTVDKRRYPYSNQEIEFNKKSILLVTADAFRGGAPVLLLHIAKELKLMGWQVVLVSKYYGELLPEFAEYSTVKVCSTIWDFKRFLNDFSKSGKFELCMCNSVLTADYIQPARDKGIDVEVLIHEMPQLIHEFKAERLAYKAATQADVLIFPSSFVKKAFETIEPIRCPIVIKPQGLYLFNKPDERFDQSAIRTWFNKVYHVDLKDEIVLNVASSDYRKGFDIFVDAAAKDASRTYIWVGYAKDEYTERVLKKNTPQNLCLIGYIHDKEELKKIYEMADFFLLTSREEPLGSVVIESFSVGLPVVAFNNCGGYVDLVINEETGLLVDSIKSEALIQAINQISMNKNLYERMRMNCINRVEKMSFSDYVSTLVNATEVAESITIQEK